jgi:hypothetical protein
MSQENALALPVLQNAGVPATLPPALMMTEDEFDELDEVSVRPLTLTFDGKGGSGFKNPETEEAIPALSGVILGTIFGQMLYPPDAEADKWPKWICRADNVKGPVTLHPELTDEQRQHALDRGAGRSCLTCPLREFGADGRPVCTGSANLLWVDSKLSEPAIVRARGQSITALKHYLSLFKRKRWAPYSHLTQLSSEGHSKGKNSWAVVVATLGPPVTEEDGVKLRQLRAEMMGSAAERLRAAADADAGEAPAAATDEGTSFATPRQTPQQPDAAPARPSTGRGVSLVPRADAARPAPAADPQEQQIEQGLSELGLGGGDAAGKSEWGW